MMIIYKCNYWFVKRVYVLCSKNFNITKEILSFKPDVVYFGNANQADIVDANDCKKSKTYSYDFAEDETELELMSKLSSDVRHDVRKCISDEKAKYEIVTSEKITRKMIKKACGMANIMFKNKGLKTRLKKKSFIEQQKCGCLVMSVSTYDGVPCVYHAYSIDNTNAICCLIATSFRDGRVQKKMSGMIHRFHTYMDMLYFQNNHFSYFDWGGISSFDNPDGIDSFKMRFPGYNNVTLGRVTPITRVGHLFCRIKIILA